MQTSNDKLTPRIQSGLSTVNNWHKLSSANPTLVKQIRDSIPFHILYPQPSSKEKPDFILIKNKKHTAKDFARPSDNQYEGNELFVNRFSLYFQKIMTWVNEPPCTICGATGKENMKCTGVRGPVSTEEKEGGASRVEMYHCNVCGDQTTTFPRYNSPQTLFETKKGRCGEYANLFGFMLHCLGYDVRYVVDFTDHVWVEVWSHKLGKWMHVDGCEAGFSVPSMYEHGWGKKLSYVLAFLPEHVVDVTKRYTRKFDTEEFQARRRFFVGSETMSDMVIAQANVALKSKNASQKRIEELEERHEMEVAFWKSVENKDWKDCEDHEELYNEGRLSGSLAWRSARDELGRGKQKKDEKAATSSTSSSSPSSSSGNFFYVEHYHPLPYSSSKDIVVTLKSPFSTTAADDDKSASINASTNHECINISSVSCAATTGLSNAISVVILDEKTRCILQSRSFLDWFSLQEFVENVPDGRIVIIVGGCKEEEKEEEKEITTLLTRKRLESRLGGFKFPSKDNEDEEEQVDKKCLLYVGQTNYNPSWSTSVHTSYGSNAFKLTLTLSMSPTTLSTTTSVPLKICRESNMIPSTISKRLPESIMPLKTQLLANGTQKHVAFLNFLKEQGETKTKKKEDEMYVGYTTAKGTPVYLFTAKDGFPFQLCGSGNSSCSSSSATTAPSWQTYHCLPEPLVPNGYDAPPSAAEEEEEEEENATFSTLKTTTKPQFDIPIETTFFNNLLGPNLLCRPNHPSDIVTLDTETALSNSRLVALYFSAHWCPPCRRFTPMLIEMYEHLKDESVLPTHGLEIVFVSSDRDENAFNHYFRTMPWLAVPFDTMQPMIKSRFGVSGIPALIVLDSMTGDVVVNMHQSRSDVMRACQGGEDEIERLVKELWLGQMLSMESKAIVESLEMSCLDEESGDNNEKKDEKVEGAHREELSESGKAYLTRAMPTHQEECAPNHEKRVNEVVEELTAPQKGMDPNLAAAKAIQMVAEEQKTKKISNPSERIKEIFTDLTKPKAGMDPGEASTIAVCRVREEEKKEREEKELNAVVVLEKGPLDKAGTVEVTNDANTEASLSFYSITPKQAAEQIESQSNSNVNSARSTIRLILTTAKKYLDNVYSNPSSFKYRHFKLSNKVFDRIVSATGGLDLIQSLGFMIYFGGIDYMACIPLGMDLGWMKESLDGLLGLYSGDAEEEENS